MQLPRSNIVPIEIALDAAEKQGPHADTDRQGPILHLATPRFLLLVSEILFQSHQSTKYIVGYPVLGKHSGYHELACCLFWFARVRNGSQMFSTKFILHPQIFPFTYYVTT
jgi:hypothetical protein